MKSFCLLISFFLVTHALFATDAPRDASSDEPLSLESLEGDQEPSASELIARIVLYMAALAAMGGALVYFSRRGSLFANKPGGERNLKICETHMLGGKQFLVVVDYHGAKWLLGVGPGMINCLTCLSSDVANPIPPNPKELFPSPK